MNNLIEDGLMGEEELKKGKLLSESNDLYLREGSSQLKSILNH